MFFDRRPKQSRHERRSRCCDDESRKHSKENRCNKSGCNEKCAYAMMDGVKFYASYCYSHATCTVEGCMATPDRLSGKPLPWFCDTRCVSYGCYGGYCSTHIALCSVGGCPGQRMHNSPFCEFHGASSRMGHGNANATPAPAAPPPPAGTHQCDANCTEHRHSNKVYRPDSFCRMPGCNRLRHTKDGGESEWCENHTCESYMCVRKRSDRQPSMKTCERHSCAVDRCDLAAQSHSTFCRRHGCEADNCAQYKEAQNWFCNQHECQRVRCPNKAVSGTDHCLRHLEEEQDKKSGKKDKPKEKRERDRSTSRDRGGYKRERSRQRSSDTPLVIVQDHSVTSSPYWREPPSSSPVGCRGRRRDPYPDCADDARVGRVHRGYYDRVSSRHRPCYWDD
ncbi:hypothetical protein PWT90_02586 [Aphanocladium album]|nr:hypothetical protein PWT90_02586 [Aphanocladium album]